MCILLLIGRDDRRVSESGILDGLDGMERRLVLDRSGLVVGYTRTRLGRSLNVEAGIVLIGFDEQE